MDLRTEIAFSGIFDWLWFQVWRHVAHCEVCGKSVRRAAGQVWEQRWDRETGMMCRAWCAEHYPMDRRSVRDLEVYKS